MTKKIRAALKSDYDESYGVLTVDGKLPDKKGNVNIDRSAEIESGEIVINSEEDFEIQLKTKGGSAITIDVPVANDSQTGVITATMHKKLNELPSETELEKELAGKQPVGNYLTEEKDPTVPAWAKEPQKPSYTFAEVGADPEGSAVKIVSAHNTNQYSHQDIRLLIDGLTTRLNLLANSDDIDLDQAAEFVAYMKANRTLIESVTTSKVSVSDIINNLTTNVSNKPLSAAMGVELKGSIDATEKKIPTKTSALTNDSGFLTSDTLENKGYMTEAKFKLGLYTIVKSVNNIKPDANGNVNVVGGDGMIDYKPTWDDLAQGNTVFVPLEVTSDDVNYGGYHKVSDEAPTLEQLQKGGKISFNEGGTGIVTMDYPEGEMAILERTNGAVIAYNGMVLVVIAFEDGMSYMGNTFEKGITFAQNDTVITHSFTLTDYVQTDEINPIPVEYLPKSHQFGEKTVMGDTLTWDGNMDGKTVVEVSFGEDEPTNYLVKVSDSTPTIAELQAGGTTIMAGTEKQWAPDEYSDKGNAFVADASGFLVIYEDNADLTDAMGLVFPEKGIYFMHAPEEGMVISSVTINGYNGFETTTIETISSEYIAPTRTYFYPKTTKLYTDEECTIEATPKQLKEAWDKGDIIVFSSGVYSRVTRISFLSYPFQVSLSVGGNDYVVGNAD